jgi:hypothetical protein
VLLLPYEGQVIPTDELRDAILARVKAGEKATTAAAALGVNGVELNVWRTIAANDPTGPHASLMRAVTQAEADAASLVERKAYADATGGDALTYLKTRWPREWSEPTRRVEQSGTVTVEHTQRTDEEREAELLRLADRASLVPVLPPSDGTH